jgi:hypothetical protein
VTPQHFRCCAGRHDDGRPCSYTALFDSDFCIVHKEQQEKDKQRERTTTKIKWKDYVP